MRECFISIDIETSGPIPGHYSMLTIGACVVHDDSKRFHALLKPLNDNFEPAAMAACGLSLQELNARGQDPQDVMQDFLRWIQLATADGASPVFVGLNAPFDWAFVNHYFLAFAVQNPFGFSALDIKAFYMGATGCSWSDTRSSRMSAHLKPSHTATHDALEDALFQAELFRLARAMKRAP
jgi:ribonuclease T